MAQSENVEIGAADLVVGLVPPQPDASGIAEAIERIVQSNPAQWTDHASGKAFGQAVLMHPPYSANGIASSHAVGEWRLIADPRLAQDQTAFAQSLGESFHVIFDSSIEAGARSCAIIASNLSTVTPEWIERLLRPSAEQDFDLVTPCYARHLFEGLINRAIVYPLVRALYGKRIRNPLGPDFGVSKALLQRMTAGPRARVHPLASLAAEASIGRMRICQVHLGARIFGQADLPNLSSILAQVLGPVFLDVERCAPYWQRTRGSEPIPEFGEPIFLPGPERGVEVTRMIESFALGARNLPEVWGIIMPPSTLVELRRLARQDAGAFRLPDETWARIIYDFALAYRLRAISRDQMLRALTPIYLGWVASYALELENAPAEAVEARLEKLCIAYENAKSYLMARWRWPDRFNP